MLDQLVVVRPWGSFIELARGPSYCVKRLVVNPGQRFSKQYHRNRDEAWVCVSGRGALIYRFPTLSYDFTMQLYAGISCKIERMTLHRAVNLGREPLVLIETQMGQCHEDDIVRLEDDYGRV